MMLETMENKIALIEIGDDRIKETKKIQDNFRAFGESTDWYVYNCKELDIMQEILDLKNFYQGIYIVGGETL